MSVAKYLARYAEPEATLESNIPGSYRAALVVPAHREPPSLLDGYVRAAEHAGGRVLVVLVVNAALDASPAARAETLQLLRELSSSPEALSFQQRDAFDLALVDRASAGRELPAKQGVGLARKIGADLALSLWAHGRVERPYVFCTDADVSLPPHYFAAGAGHEAAALLYPFRHVPGAAPEVDAATELYETSLRYHVLGLGWAGSPYAFHSIGSTLALRCEQYAAVRGFPKRQAAEDFYVLDKLAKVGDVLPLGGEPVRIRARLSDRVPFGTGARVGELCAGDVANVYHPQCYRALAAVLSAFAELAKSRGPFELESAALAALHGLGFERELAQALEQSKTETVLLRRLLTWFDALKTLRFIHALRDSTSPDLPLDSALREAPFVPSGADVPALIGAEQARSGPRGVAACLGERLSPNLR